MKVRSKRKVARQRRIYITAGTFAAIIVCGLLLPKLFSTVVDVVMQPIHSLHVWINESNSVFPQYIRDRRTLSGRITELETALAQQSGADASRQYLIEENERLRALLHAPYPRRIAAAVIARPDQLPYDVLEIDQGSEAGIEVGAPVFINAHVAIGLVSYAAPTYALVELLSSPDFHSTVFIGGPNVVAELVGQGGGVARVRVPQGIPLAVGNTVSLPSINTSVLGRIVEVENIPTQAEQYGYVTLPLSLQQLHTVSVGTKGELRTDVVEIEHSIQESLRQKFVVSGLATSSFAISSTTVFSEETASSTE
ncbi:hypothetical protein KC887_03925 [Candidatus Kaiserbacteria bacterium]|nr:hypothetical protein [Candidatus Kaiserbacteria bacterium]